MSLVKTRIHIEGKLPEVFALSRRQLADAARAFAEKSAARVRGVFREVTVILQNDAESDEVHRAVMATAGATDVITQRYDALPGEAPGVYGELYVNTDQALRVAKRFGRWQPRRELLLYVAHGMDHLSGADDITAEGYSQMRRRELRWLSSLALK